jgi:gluconate 2-dehydrogenase gamma chain
MIEGPSSRRLFLKQSAFGIGGAVLINLVPEVLHAARLGADAAALAGDKFAVFSPEEGADLKAFAAQIFPTDETPGANEANVVYFIDHVLDKFEPENQANFRDCLKQLNEASAQAIPGSKHFSALSHEQQVAVLEKFQTVAKKRRSDLMGSFFGGISNPFETMRTYVIAGFLSDPDNGGNKDSVGWQLIGFDGMAMHEPPFGFYDAELLKQEGEKK